MNMRDASHEPLADGARATSPAARPESHGLGAVPNATQGPKRCGRGRPRAIGPWFMDPMRDFGIVGALHEPISLLAFILTLITALYSPLLRAGIPLDVPSIEIEDGGFHRQFVLAADELCLRRPDGEEQIVKASGTEVNLPPLSSLLLPYHGREGENGTESAPVLYEVNAPRTAASRRVVTRKILLRLADGVDPALVAQQAGATAIRVVDYAPGYFIAETSEAADALRLTAALRQTEGVLTADPILGRKLSKKILPNDRYFPDQWFLLNTGQSRGKPGIDLNIVSAWEKYRGRGVNIAIVDDGLQLAHPDIAPNVVSRLHHDYRDNDTDANPGGTDDYHGTAVAGVVAARGNNSLGVTGVAFEAGLVGIRLVGGFVHTDEQSAAAILHSNRVIHVSNNSWGAEDGGRNLDGPGPLMRTAREIAVRNGRDGKGTILVWSGGNGREVQDDVNYDGYSNSMHVFPVAAINDLGKQAAYSEPGACLVVTTPSNVGESSAQEGIVTADLIGDDGLNYVPVGDDLPDTSYTRYFGGTSAAAAMVSGVAALVLEANPNLGWRDVKEILMRSATQVDPSDQDWINNGSGLRFNHKYGGGLVNASAAVTLARNWMNLGPQIGQFQERTNLALSIPDNDPNGTSLVFDFRRSPAIRVEHAVVTSTILHPRRGDLAITLISPHGTRSRLAERHADQNADYPGWSFTSVANWGETSQGQWRIHVADLRAALAGLIRNIRLELFGSDASEQTQPWLNVIPAPGGKIQIRMTGRPGYRYEIQASTNFADWLTILSRNLPSGTTIELNDVDITARSARFFRAVRFPLPEGNAQP
jgi:subtilisin-like proprotein convertase family protein/subtilisin family serine protease